MGHAIPDQNVKIIYPVQPVKPMDNSDLLPDCDNCLGLCCVAPGFAASATFAYSKPEGETCRHLDAANRYEIHAALTDKGFAGCVAYQCYGAGLKVVQQIYPGRSWRENEAFAVRMFRTFFQVKALHELLSYLEEAAEIATDPALGGEIAAKRQELGELTVGLPCRLHLGSAPPRRMAGKSKSGK